MMKTKAFQIYGYVVCVIAIVAFLITLAGLVTSLMDMNAPLYAGWGQGASLSSFESYKVDVMKNVTSEAAYVPGEAELRTMYDAALKDEIARRTHNTQKSIMGNAIVLVAAVILFFAHWKWVVRGGRGSATEVDGH